MRNIKNYKSSGQNSRERRRIVKHYYQIIVYILAVTLITACSSTPPFSSPATDTPLTPTTLPAAPTSSPPTDTPTALSVTATDPSPTVMVSTTEEVETEADQDNSNVMEINIMNIKIGDTVLTATLAENSSVDALKAALSEGPIIISMRDYGNMEKVGPLGMELPRNDEQITTQAGDIILYQGNMLVIYYAPNSWNFTRLGKINDVSASELREILGDGNVTITLSLP